MATDNTTDQYWNSLYDAGRDYSLMTSETLTKLLTYIGSNKAKNCLDIGCGTGQLTRELYHRGYTCTGIDASRSAINIARSLTTVPKNQLTYSRVDFEEETGDILDCQYTLITCKLVYAFIKDKKLFLERVRKLLTTDGRFIVITPLRRHTLEAKHTIAVTDADIALLSEYFEQIAFYTDSNPYGALTYFVGK